MSLFTNIAVFPPITPPTVDPELNDLLMARDDDRLKIAELEAFFEKYQDELSKTVCRNVSPVGTNIATIPAPDGRSTPVVSDSNPPARLRAVQSSLYGARDSLVMDLETSSDINDTQSQTNATAHSIGRLPRRIVASVRSGPDHDSASFSHQFNTPTINRGRFGVGLAYSPPFIDTPRSGATDSPVGAGWAGAESSDNFLIEEQEAEAATNSQDDLDEGAV